MLSPKGIANIVAKMTPPSHLLNADSVLIWRLEKAAELSAELTVKEIFKAEFNKYLKK